MVDADIRHRQEIRIKQRKSQQRPARTTFLPFSRPFIEEEEIQAVTDTLRSGWITTGPKTKQFESEFAAFLGVEEALALNSCTAGLHLALEVLGIGPGDQVITTPFTFCSSANVIEHVGAETVLVDIEPRTLNLNPDLLARAITPSTRAIIAVHFAGHPVAMQDVVKLAQEYGLFVIEDAAHAIPAHYQGRMVGTLGDLASFSFYATKNMTTAEGGMLVGSPTYMERARVLSLHGMSHDAWRRYSSEGSWWYDVVEPGFKYNMTDIQASLGLVQIKRLADMQQRRNDIARQYSSAFMQFDELEVPTERADSVSAWHLYVLRLRLDRLSINRAKFIEELKARNIGTSVHFIPLHIHPYYREKYGWMPFSFPIAYQEFQRVLSLPLYPGMSDDDVADVIDAVIDVVKEFPCPNVFSISRSVPH